MTASRSFTSERPMISSVLRIGVVSMDMWTTSLCVRWLCGSEGFDAGQHVSANEPGSGGPVADPPVRFGRRQVGQQQASGELPCPLSSVAVQPAAEEGGQEGSGERKYLIHLVEGQVAHHDLAFM